MPQLTDMFGLNNGVPASWLKLLTDAVYSMQRSRMPLELIVNQLPEPSSDSNQVLRKRLQQWIDQGLLKLYQTSEEAALPILCLSTQQQNRIALELHRRSEEDEALEWFQTRSQEGVERVYNRLQNVVQATLVPAAELEDPDTFVVCPEPSWGYLSLLELRQSATWMAKKQKLSLNSCTVTGWIQTLRSQYGFLRIQNPSLLKREKQS